MSTPLPLMELTTAWCALGLLDKRDDRYVNSQFSQDSNAMDGLFWDAVHSLSVYHTWLTEAGFTDVHTIRFEAAGANGVVIGRKP